MDKFHGAEHIERINQILTEILTECYAEPEAQPILISRPKSETIERFFEGEPPKSGLGLEATLELFRGAVLPNSVKTWHPMFMNQMFAGASYPAVVGDLLAAMMNPTLATYEAAPAGTVIERSVASWMANLLGMKPGSSGIFLPGGSVSNLVALTLARNSRLSPDLGRAGLYGETQKAVIFCSEASHYSVANAANILGIGSDQVVKVKTNERNEMLIDDFEAQVLRVKAEGLIPMAAVATMGITVTGCFDPLADMVPICKAHNIHLHVDAAFGGGISLAQEGREVLAGIEEADSVIWDAHKWLHVPLTTTVLLVPNAGILKQVFSTGADYLYHPQDEEVDLADDLGHYTILCGKRFDALRIWLMFKAFGTEYFKDVAEQRLQTTRAFAAHIEADPDFVLSYQPRSPLMCFRYIPASVRDRDGAWLDRLQRFIREECKKRGKALYNMAKLKGRTHFRMVLVNPLTTAEHLKALMEEMRTIGEEYLQTER